MMSERMVGRGGFSGSDNSLGKGIDRLSENNSEANEEQLMDRKNEDSYQQFIRVIHSVQEFIKTSDRMPDREEIADYFKEMKLSLQQQEMVYQYFEQLREENGNQSFEMPISIEKEENVKDQREKVKLPETGFFRFYLEDIKKRKRYTKEEEETLYQRLVAGDTTVIQTLSEQWMHKVLQIAQNQVQIVETKDVADVIQEGNMAVFLSLQQLAGSGKMTDFNQELTSAAKYAIVIWFATYFGFTSDGFRMLAEEEMDQSILAKAALVYEARKFMTEKLQRIPTVAELSQYTKMSETELEDILCILEEKK